MRATSFPKLLLIVSLGIWILPGLILAQELNNNEVEFTGMISSVVVNGDGLGTVFVRVEGFDLRVIVNSRTELQDKNGDEMAMSGLAKDLPVEVTGRYSSSGILASRIRSIGEPDDSFVLRGHITAVQPSESDWLVSLLGITVAVKSDTKIDDDGVGAAPSSLKPGMLVQIQGDTSKNPWVATSISLLAQNTKKGKVRFEGVVAAVGEGSIEVAVKGLTDNVTKVLLNSNTLITGSLAKDAFVLVIGYLNPDLSVAASEVRVLPAMDIKPDERKLKVGETGVFTVKLREPASAGVVIALSLSDGAVLSLTTTSVTIPKGSSVADFSVIALKIGTAEITADASGQKAIASVTVGKVSENENERPAGETRIVFAPDKIKLAPNETRDVVLLVKPPQKVPVVVNLNVTGGLAAVSGTRTLGVGAAELKVTVQAGAKAGSDSLVATLPAELGGGKAELVIEISDKKGGPGNRQSVEIAFRPDGIILPVGETRSVNLMLNRSLDKDVEVTLVNSASDKIDVPPTLIIPAWTRSIQVTVTGKAAGNAKVTAGLPSDVSSDTAELEVEVRS